MLLLEFSIAAHPYAIRAKDVVEVVPAVPLAERPGALPLLEYRGGSVPVLDLRERYKGEATALSLVTRIVLIGERGQRPALGLLAERVTDTVRVRELSGFEVATTPVPAHRATDEQGRVRYLVDLEQLRADAARMPARDTRGGRPGDGPGGR